MKFLKTIIFSKWNLKYKNSKFNSQYNFARISNICSKKKQKRNKKFFLMKKKTKSTVIIEIILLLNLNIITSK